MKNMSETIVKTIKKVMPAVVSVIISKSLKEIEKELPQEMMPLMPFGMPELKIPEDKIDSRGMVQVGGGSGFITDPSGIILTNKHVIADPTAEYTIITSDDKKYEAEVIARDPIEDIAILKIKANGLPTISLGNSATSTPASFSAFIFDSAVPAVPSIIAPACPIFFLWALFVQQYMQ